MVENEGMKKVTGVETVEGTSPRQHLSEVLQQCRKLPHCPMKMVIGGFTATVVLSYFILYSKKKPKASAMDVAKVAIGISHPNNTHPHN